MKTTTFRSMALALGLGLTTAAAAQPIVIEAEDPIDQFEAKMADFSAEGSEASGGAGMGLDNAHHGAFLQYAFEVPSAGTYDLKIFYVTLNTRWLSVKINDQVANVVRFTDFTGNWNGVPGEVLDEESGEMIARPGVASKTIQVYCEEGENFLRIDALYGYSPEDGRDLPFSPSIDKFELTKSATEIAKPEDWTAEGNQIKQEFEDFTTASGQGKVQNLGGLTGAAIGQGGGTLSYDVNVPEEGVYKLNIWFATAQRRWVTVKVNEQVPASPYL